MKNFLLSMMLCMPMMLAAQNGVTVSGLAINAGTVTFNVSWDRDAMPSLWSDSVWVFVDYNNASKMTRLPVTGIIASAGTATMTPGNDKGAWVIGNARSAGSFSATVTLLTATADIAGACAYASNYPPVGEYHNDYTEIVFTGTPMYDLVLEHTNGSTVTVQAGGTFLVPCDYTLISFTDATTGTPGILPPTCHAPGSTVNFTAFSPCANAASGSTWSLVDTREASLSPANSQTYTVKLMADGRYWMVQDLKFGNKCGTDFAGSNGDQTGKVTSLAGTYYGDCTTYNNGSVPAVRGYLYDWAAAMNKANAYKGGSYAGCTGTPSGYSLSVQHPCQGICPAGWHVPSGDAAGEQVALRAALIAPGSGIENTSEGERFIPSTNVGIINNDPYTFHLTLSCIVWVDNSMNYCSSFSYLRSSSSGNADLAKHMLCSTSGCSVNYTHSLDAKDTGQLVRCLRNY